MFASIQVKGAPQGSGHAAVSTGREIVLFGPSVHLLSIDGQITCQAAVVTGKGPSPRKHTTATLVDDSRVYLFGGRTLDTKTAVNELYLFDTDSLSWKAVVPKNDGPAPRWGHSAVATKAGKIIIYGGTDGLTVFDDDYAYDTATNEWTALESKYKPSVGRFAHTATRICNRIYYFGGLNESDEPLAGPRVYDIDTNEWEAQSPLVDDRTWGSPEARGGHFAASLQDDKFLLIGGGASSLQRERTFFHDVHLLDIERQTWQRATVGKNISTADSSVIVTDNRIFLYGGANEDGVLEIPLRVSPLDKFIEGVAKFMQDNNLSEGTDATRLTKPKSKLRLKFDQEKAARVRLQAHCALLENKLYNRSKAKELTLELLVRQLREKDLEIAALRKKNELLRARFQAAGASHDEEMKDAASDILFLWNKHEEFRRQRDDVINAMAVHEAALQKKMAQFSQAFGEDLTAIAKKQKAAQLPQNSALMSVKASKRALEDGYDKDTAGGSAASAASPGAGTVDAEKSEEYMAWLDHFNEKLERDRKASVKVVEPAPEVKPLDVSKVSTGRNLGVSPRKARDSEEQIATLSASSSAEKSGSTSPGRSRRNNSNLSSSSGPSTREERSATISGPPPSFASLGSSSSTNRRDSKDTREGAHTKETKDSKDGKEGSKKSSLSEQFLSGKGTFSKRLLQVTSKVSRHFNKIKAEHEKDHSVTDEDVPGIFKPPAAPPKLNIPLSLDIVDRCISYLDSHMDYEGLFRVSGVAAQVKVIHAKLADGSDFSTEENPHNVAGALKLYLRELDQPLIPFTFYDSIVAAMRKYEVGKDVAELKKSVESLPDLNLRVLGRLAQFLGRVASFAEKNRMDLKNLGIVFGPTLLRPAKETLEKMMADTNTVNGFIAVCCEKSTDLFSSVLATIKEEDDKEDIKEESGGKETPSPDGNERKKKKKEGR